jgi:hypothetical protein
MPLFLSTWLTALDMDGRISVTLDMLAQVTAHVAS